MNWTCNFWGKTGFPTYSFCSILIPFSVYTTKLHQVLLVSALVLGKSMNVNALRLFAPSISSWEILQLEKDEKNMDIIFPPKQKDSEPKDHEQGHLVKQIAITNPD